MSQSAPSTLQFRSDALSGGAISTPGRITMSGVLHESRGVPAARMRVLGSYALVYLLAGSGRYRDAQGIDLPVRPGDCLLIYPEVAHCYGPGECETWDEVYLVFEGAVFDLWRSSGLLQAGRPVWHPEPAAQWRARIEQLVHAGRPLTPGEQVLEAVRLLELLTAMAGVAQATAAGRPTPWLQRACVLLESDLEREISLEDVAREAGLSYESFRKQFQRLTGVSPARFRTGRIIDAACAMMQYEGSTNKEIARRLGFADEYYFSRRFREVTGLTPREFRRRLPRLGGAAASPEVGAA